MTNILGTPPFSAHFDGNQVPTMMGVVGTMGTSDEAGTSQTLPIGVNPATGAVYVEDLSGVSGTTNVQGSVQVTGGSVIVTAGTQQTLGTVGVVNSIVAGTQNTLGTVGVVNNVVTGTLASVGEVVKGTTTLVSTVTTLSNLTNGSVNILTGTIQSSGTTTGVGVVSNLTNGSINLLTGTLTSGSLSNVAMVHAGTHVHPSGTVTTIVAGTQNTLGTVGVVNNIVTGTLASVAEVVKGTTTLVSTVTTVSNLTNGSVIVQSGTLGSVAAVAQVHNAGTIQAGTVQINPDPVPTTLEFGTLGTAGGSFFGTLSAASGAGTKHFISGFQIVVQSGTPDVRILAGSAIQGTGFIAGGAFPPGAGIARDKAVAFETGTNSEILYHFVSAGTALIGISYWKGA